MKIFFALIVLLAVISTSVDSKALKLKCHEGTRTSHHLSSGKYSWCEAIFNLSDAEVQMKGHQDPHPDQTFEEKEDYDFSSTYSCQISETSNKQIIATCACFTSRCNAPINSALLFQVNKLFDSEEQ